MKAWLILILGSAAGGLLIAVTRELAPYWAGNVGMFAGLLIGMFWKDAVREAQMRRLRASIENIKAALAAMVVMR